MQRFCYAYRRAATAVTVTSATTVLGMIAAGLSRIPMIGAFGLFGSLVVLLDYVLVISFFAAALLVTEATLERSHACCSSLVLSILSRQGSSTA